MKLARINVIVSLEEKQVLFDYQSGKSIKTLDEALGELLKDYKNLVE